ncbi:hypothetical protein [Prescottella agglutinans]|uniref:Uncharacterized protein n=1 Tax=Prescottella agglutinans TaxID=1644129 RepID=A0ABT6MFQ4_9NOCA|nr:hypothetical protein [Prescottella agglutinans]MDH6283142.1 hypothetical protein [Prescottella agglutinans]
MPDAMTPSKIRAARLALIDERLSTISVQAQRLHDHLSWATTPAGDYTKLRRLELQQLEAESELLRRERVAVICEAVPA